MFLEAKKKEHVGYLFDFRGLPNKGNSIYQQQALQGLFVAYGRHIKSNKYKVSEKDVRCVPPTRTQNLWMLYELSSYSTISYVLV